VSSIIHDSRPGFLSSWVRRTAVLVGALVLLAIYFFYVAAKFRFHELIAFEGDATIIYLNSTLIAETGRYPAQSVLGNFNAIFPYPPSSILIFATLSKLPQTPFIAVWEIATFVALFASVRLSVEGEQEDVKRAWPLLLLPAILLVFNPIEYDLRNKNVNLIILALTMLSCATAKKRPVVSGLLVAVTTSLKLYSGVLLLWMIAFNRRAAISALIMLVVLWVVVPGLYWGPEGLIEVYRGWFDQLVIANGAWVYALQNTGIGPPLTSLRSAAAKMVTSDPFSMPAQRALWAMQAFWLSIIGWYAYRAWWRRPMPASWRQRLADWSVLLVVPLPFSPWLEPYHAVVLLPGSVLCIVLALDASARIADRLTAVIACIGILAVKLLPISFEARGAVFLTQFVFVTVALAIIHPRLSGKPL
jgi:Glycosyltransferase family 87